MNFKALILGIALLAASIGGAQAQRIVNGSDVDDILAIAKTHGEATLETQSDGNPRIIGHLSDQNDLTYAVYFMNCSDANTDCEDLNFYAGFADVKPTLDTINAWNRDKRFGKAYLDADLDAVVEFDFNLEYGVTRDNLVAGFDLWSLIVKQYTDYIGYN
jgi:hypothetical protein